jgi:hypothetical protein
VSTAGFKAALQRDRALLGQLDASERWPMVLLLIEQRLLQLQDALQLLASSFADVREAAAWLAGSATSWPGGWVGGAGRRREARRRGLPLRITCRPGHACAAATPCPCAGAAPDAPGALQQLVCKLVDAVHSGGSSDGLALARQLLAEVTQRAVAHEVGRAWCRAQPGAAAAPAALPLLLLLLLRL